MPETSAAPSIRLLGTQLTLYDQDQLLAATEDAILHGCNILVLSCNVHSFNLAYENPWLQDFLNQADIVRLDGAGLRLGAKLKGYPTPPRTTWADFGWALAEFAAQRGFSLFLLGGSPGIAEKASDRLLERNPTLRIVGVHHGYFEKGHGHPQNQQVLQTINEAQPDILIVGFGMPLQERWLMENRPALTTPHVIMTGGAVFDYISGAVRRGPIWLTDFGFEWLARLLVQPARLWRRYLIGNPLFFARLLLERKRGSLG